jgi:hypothetical protein
LTQVPFDTFPPAQDDLLCRTLVGVMMGLLPTADGNFVAAYDELHGSGDFITARDAIMALGDGVDFDGARAVPAGPVCAAVQEGPQPEAVWRTAAKDHFIGDTNPVAVKAGDMIIVSIENATREDLSAGIQDVSAIFGGDRSATPQPLHGCPGFAVSMGLLYGAVTAMLQDAAARQG